MADNKSSKIIDITKKESDMSSDRRRIDNSTFYSNSPTQKSSYKPEGDSFILPEINESTNAQGNIRDANSYVDEVAFFFNQLSTIYTSDKSIEEISKFFEEYSQLIYNISELNTQAQAEKYKELDKKLGTSFTPEFAAINFPFTTKTKEFFCTLVELIKDPSNNQKKEDLNKVTIKFKELIKAKLKQFRQTIGFPKTEHICQNETFLPEDTKFKKSSFSLVAETSTLLKENIRNREGILSITPPSPFHTENMSISSLDQKENVRPTLQESIKNNSQGTTLASPSLIIDFSQLIKDISLENHSINNSPLKKCKLAQKNSGRGPRKPNQHRTFSR